MKTCDKPYFTTTRNNIYSCPPSLKEISIIKNKKRKTAEPEIEKNVKKGKSKKEKLHLRCRKWGSSKNELQKLLSLAKVLGQTDHPKNSMNKVHQEGGQWPLGNGTPHGDAG